MCVLFWLLLPRAKKSVLRRQLYDYLTESLQEQGGEDFEPPQVTRVACCKRRGLEFLDQGSHSRYKAMRAGKDPDW